jgi:hypothetical protein
LVSFEFRGLGTGDWGLGTGDWGLGTGDWGLGTGDWGLGTGDWGGIIRWLFMYTMGLLKGC